MIFNDAELDEDKTLFYAERATFASEAGKVSLGVDIDDIVVGASVCKDGDVLLSICENGFGKKTDIDEFKVQTRGGKGVMGYRVTDKTGCVAGISVLSEEKDVMIITSDGIIIRCATDEISKFQRATQGVKVMRLADEVKVVSITISDKEEDEEVIEGEENANEETTEAPAE
jgi:DNA gyrase subunit A